MALWVCGGEAGCGTKYAVGLFRCPRCHNTAFYEDGDPMAKISRYGGASDKTLPAPETEAEAVESSASTLDVEEPLDVTEYLAGPPEPVVEGGEEPSPGSSSSASTETPPTNSEPSSKTRPRRARKTASRFGQGQTGSSSAPSTAGQSAEETSQIAGSD